MTSTTIQADVTASTTLAASPTASTTLSTEHRRTISVVAGGGLISSATFTRADTANEFNSSGIMQEAASGEARTTWIGGNPYLWIDGSVTEISGRSADLGNWANSTATATKDEVGLDGNNNTGWTLTDDDATLQIHGNNISGLADDTGTYYGVCAIKKESSPATFPTARFRLSGGTSVDQRLLLDRSDGSYLEPVSEGTVVLDPILIGDYWFFVVSVTNNGTGNTNLLEAIYPAYNADGAVAAEESATGSVIAGYVGVFKGNFSLMPILTTGGTTKTVAADVASLTNSIISSLTEGTIYAEVWVPATVTTDFKYVTQLQSDIDNRTAIFIRSDGDTRGFSRASATTDVAINTSSVGSGSLQKIALAFGTNNYALYVNGSKEGEDSSAAVPPYSTMDIGYNATGVGEYLHGGIKTLDVYPTRKTNSELATLTT